MEDGEEQVIEELREQIVFEPGEADIDPDVLLRGKLGDALGGTEFGNSVILPTEAAETLSAEPYRGIVSILRGPGAESVTDLAEQLGKNKSTVTRQLSVLMRYDVVELVEDGNRKRPQLKHEHVVFQPLY